MSNPYNKDYPISWEELHRNARALAWRLLDQGPWKGIIAITRGGLVPAAIIARELDIRLIDTICISSYDQLETCFLYTSPSPRDRQKSRMPSSA